MGRRDGGGGLFRTVLLGGGVVVVAFLLATALGIDLPFGTERKDHSPPPILTELRGMSDLHSAQAEFEVVIDHEDDVRFMPSVLAGERVQYVAVGTVDAIVDLDDVTGDAVRFDEETNRAVVYLPRPTISEPVLDMEQSHVMNRDRGLLNRLGGLFSDNPTAERALIQAAQAKMAEAAAQTGLVAMAEQEAEDTLEPLILELGVDSVEVRFYDGEAPPDCADPDDCS